MSHFSDNRSKHRCYSATVRETYNKMEEKRVEEATKEKTPPKRGSKLVGERGFEPPTHWSQTSCATKLRYSPNYCFFEFLVQFSCGAKRGT